MIFPISSYGFVTPLTPMLLTDPINNLPVIDDSLSPPTILHTGTNMDILRSLLQDLPGKTINLYSIHVGFEALHGEVHVSIFIWFAVRPCVYLLAR